MKYPRTIYEKLYSKRPKGPIQIRLVALTIEEMMAQSVVCKDTASIYMILNSPAMRLTFR